MNRHADRGASIVEVLRRRFLIEIQKLRVRVLWAAEARARGRLRALTDRFVELRHTVRSKRSVKAYRAQIARRPQLARDLEIRDSKLEQSIKRLGALPKPAAGVQSSENEPS